MLPYDPLGMNTPLLFSPLAIRGVVLPNRLAMSPMCQYSAVDGFAGDWHLVHLGSRAVGGAGLIMVEATAVSPEGRISPGDLGLWDNAHIAPLARIARFITSQGAVPGLQLAHAGRKASCHPSWAGGKPLTDDEGAWPVLAPSPLAFGDGSPVPHPLRTNQIEVIGASFAAAARRGVEAGFKVIEIHAAHGYLLHEFLSPLTNHRNDAYGGGFTQRARFLHDVVAGVRAAMPLELPLFVRISATDWVPGGWDLPQSTALAASLKGLGVDLIDVSSGGLLAGVPIAVAEGYQVPFARHLRSNADILTGAVGLITRASFAENVLRERCADLVFVGRELLRDPYWTVRAQRELGAGAAARWPLQYQSVTL